MRYEPRAVKKRPPMRPFPLIKLPRKAKMPIVTQMIPVVFMVVRLYRLSLNKV